MINVDPICQIILTIQLRYRFSYLQVSTKYCRGPSIPSLLLGVGMWFPRGMQECLNQLWDWHMAKLEGGNFILCQKRARYGCKIWVVLQLIYLQASSLILVLIPYIHLNTNPTFLPHPQWQVLETKSIKLCMIIEGIMFA